MLSQRDVNIGALLIWTSIAVGIGLLILAQVLGHDDLARWGLVVVILSCTYSVHRTLAHYDERLRQAFSMGREHERGQVHSLR